MQVLTPAQAALFRDTVAVPWLSAVHQITRRVIEAVKDGMFQPTSGSRNAIDLAWHIVSAELRFLLGVAESSFDLSSKSLPDGVHDGPGLSRWYASAFDAAIQKLKEARPESLTKTVTYREKLQFPAIFFLQVALTHTVHHRGQLSVYLRLMGLEVPAIYA